MDRHFGWLEASQEDRLVALNLKRINKFGQMFTFQDVASMGGREKIDLPT